MKAGFWDKVLMFLYVLIALFFGVCMALRPFGVDMLGGLFAGLDRSAGRFLSALVGLGLAAIVVLLSAYMLMMIFGKGKKRVPASFVAVDSEDGSQVHMSLTALAQMARQAIGRVPDVKEMKIGVTNEGDAVNVAVDLTIKASAHVPTVTKNMQKAIRNSLETNGGVTVRDVQIVVSSLSGADVKGERKKPLWKRGRDAKEETVEAAAAQEAAAPLPEIPEEAGGDVDDASVGAEEAAAAAGDEWTGSFAPLDDGPELSSLDEDAADQGAPEADGEEAAFILDDDDDDDDAGALFTPSAPDEDEDGKTQN